MVPPPTLADLFWDSEGMQTIRVAEKTGKDGVLHLRIAVGQPDVDFEAVVVLQPSSAAKGGAEGEATWPEGYFDRVAGSIADETFTRPPQGSHERRLELP